MAPVNHLAQNGVQVLIAGGMGMRPLMGFNQVGIDVLYGNGAQTVGDAVEAFLNGNCSSLPVNSPVAAVVGLHRCENLCQRGEPPEDTGTVPAGEIPWERACRLLPEGFSFRFRRFR